MPDNLLDSVKAEQNRAREAGKGSRGGFVGTRGERAFHCYPSFDALIRCSPGGRCNATSFGCFQFTDHDLIHCRGPWDAGAFARKGERVSRLTSIVSLSILFPASWNPVPINPLTLEYVSCRATRPTCVTSLKRCRHVSALTQKMYWSASDGASKLAANERFSGPFFSVSSPTSRKIRMTEPRGRVAEAAKCLVQRVSNFLAPRSCA